MKRGWISLWRRLWDNPRSADSEWLAVWVYILTHATHRVIKKVFDGKIVELQPGQLITGRHTIADATGVNESKVTRVLTILKTDQQIDQQAGVKGSIITVLNWQRYQKSDQEIDQRVTSDRPATDQRLTTNNNRINNTTEKQDKTTTPPDGVKGFVTTFVDVFKAQFSVDYSTQKADFVQLAKWRKSHPEITPEQFAETCRQVWADPYHRKRWLTLRGICPDWSPAVASLKQPDVRSNRKPTEKKYAI